MATSVEIGNNDWLLFVDFLTPVGSEYLAITTITPTTNETPYKITN